MPSAPVRYRSYDDDSSRWLSFPFREGDIVISTRSKSGTTWMQMICALLVLQTPELPAPLPTLSPWLDWLVEPREDVYRRLAEQDHRRFIKTHTPLDGLPIDPRATYVVVARHPLDMAVSLYHHAENLDRDRMRELISPDEPGPPRRARPELREWVLGWIERDDDPREQLDSLAGVMLHLSDAWSRRTEPNVVLVHYDDLSADLAGEMRRLAERLGITVPEERWPALVRAASFDQMRADADRVAPDPAGIMKSKAAFFRSGTSGAGRDMLSDDELARYRARAAELAPPDMLAWLHRDAHAPDAEVYQIAAGLADRYADALRRLGTA
ncbi:sulfotransferase domain-containing protein [Phytoactinopolyspora alkaliphila]|uniref:Sulfotransferase domain-containing protein n=1 Tax=Phytoactinopolyspora alkaliphila TaxID=1783498 RepID=A0A6N9YRT2_9ACTN|nr:sulfotransferase domain-containing protein [Phytoactinopolyspora alkaliphila]NED97684.1 sulfotransferase domain-containing protein [Phytoactinopolyspora alkaliphila]